MDSLTKRIEQAYSKPASLNDFDLEVKTANDEGVASFLRVLAAFKAKRAVPAGWNGEKYHWQNAFAKCLAMMYYELNNGVIPVAPH